jgi:16S rRNA (uracil1498-N3)-methyltransferase
LKAPRFHLDRALAPGQRVELPPAVAHHAQAVLRLREGDALVLFNGQGGEWRARLLGAVPASRRLQAELIAFDPVEREPALRITLIQALASADKIDWMVEKAVEIGVARVVVTPAVRSTVRLDEARRARRLAHWNEIAAAACCQCGRNRLVPVLASATFVQALEAAAASGPRWILDPGAARGLQAPAPGAGEVTLAIGPEGGFDAAELALAGQAGFEPVRLGARTLRTETAGLAAASACLALAGEFSSVRD